MKFNLQLFVIAGIIGLSIGVATMFVFIATQELQADLFCEKYDMVYQFGGDDIFDYCIDSNNEAHRILFKNNVFQFITIKGEK